MRLPIDVDQLAGVDMGVALRSTEARVAEHLLDPAQVGAAFEEMGCERMSQGVRRNAVARAADRHIFLHQPMHAAGPEALATVIEE